MIFWVTVNMRADGRNGKGPLYFPLSLFFSPKWDQFGGFVSCGYTFLALLRRGADKKLQCFDLFVFTAWLRQLVVGALSSERLLLSGMKTAFADSNGHAADRGEHPNFH